MLLSPSTGSANFAEAVELSGYLGSAQPWGKTVAAHAEQATRGWRFVTWAGSSAAAEPTAYAKFAEPVEAIKKGKTRDKVASASAGRSVGTLTASATSAMMILRIPLRGP